MEKDKQVMSDAAKGERKAYSSPKIEKRENLKEITLLSFNPPTETAG